MQRDAVHAVVNEMGLATARVGQREQVVQAVIFAEDAVAFGVDDLGLPVQAIVHEFDGVIVGVDEEAEIADGVVLVFRFAALVINGADAAVDGIILIFGDVGSTWVMDDTEIAGSIVSKTGGDILVGQVVAAGNSVLNLAVDAIHAIIVVMRDDAQGVGFVHQVAVPVVGVGPGVAEGVGTGFQPRQAVVGEGGGVGAGVGEGDEVVYAIVGVLGDLLCGVFLPHQAVSGVVLVVCLVVVGVGEGEEIAGIIIPIQRRHIRICRLLRAGNVVFNPLDISIQQIVLKMGDLILGAGVACQRAVAADDVRQIVVAIVLVKGVRVFRRMCLNEIVDAIVDVGPGAPGGILHEDRVAHGVVIIICDLSRGVFHTHQPIQVRIVLVVSLMEVGIGGGKQIAGKIIRIRRGHVGFRIRGRARHSVVNPAHQAVQRIVFVMRDAAGGAGIVNHGAVAPGLVHYAARAIVGVEGVRIFGRMDGDLVVDRVIFIRPDVTGRVFLANQVIHVVVGERCGES